MVVKSVKYVKDFGYEINEARSAAQKFKDTMGNMANVAVSLQGITGAIGQINNVLGSACLVFNLPE